MKFAVFLQNRIFGNVIYGLCALLMAILIGYTLAKLFFSGTKQDKLDYLKNYKKGQFIFIYVIAVPLYFMGFVNLTDFTKDQYYGTHILECLFNAIKCSLSLVKLDFGMDGVSEYMMANGLYYAVTTSCFFLTILNVIMFTASLLWQRTMNFFLGLSALSTSEIYVAVGENENNVHLLKSIRAQGKRGLLFANPNNEMRDRLYVEKIPFLKFKCDANAPAHLNAKIVKLFGRALKTGGRLKKNVVLIINTEDDELNLLLTREAEKLLKEQLKNQVGYTVIKNLPDRKPVEEIAPCTSLCDVSVVAKTGYFGVYVYGELENKAVYSEIIDKSQGHINFLNRYELISVDFIKNYPFTRFMTEEQLDLKRGLVRNDCKFNVCMIGFGPTMKQTFLRMVSDAQFYTESDGKIVHKKVNYYFFDCKPSYSDKIFNQTYNRFTHQFLKNEYSQESFLPLPDYPANDGLYREGKGVREWNDNNHFFVKNINDYSFMSDLCSILADGEKAYNYIIISYGDDLENIDLAKKINDTIQMEGVLQRSYLFVKVRNKNLSDSLKSAQDTNSGCIIYPFGCAVDTVFNVNNVINDTVKEMALFKSFSYPRNERSVSSWNNRYEAAIEKWKKYKPEQKASNYYGALNLRLKLNLMGFDYAPKAEKIPDATSEFYRMYFGTDVPEEVERLRYWFEENKKTVTVDGKDKTVKGYNKSIYTDSSVRTEFARQEHQRWNAYYVVSGVVPLSKKKIYETGGQDMDRMRHGCLTTFEGLEEYRKIIARDLTDDNYTGEAREYDYKIMDFADLILDNAGYKIVKKQRFN